MERQQCKPEGLGKLYITTHYDLIAAVYFKPEHKVEVNCESLGSGVPGLGHDSSCLHATANLTRGLSHAQAGRLETSYAADYLKAEVNS